jgi:hypothetical protein
MSTPGVAVLKLADEFRRKADVVGEFNATEAAIIRAVVERFATVVENTMAEWWTLEMVRAAKPWSYRWLRRRCRELAGEGKARKGPAGRWELRWDVVLAMKEPPARLDEILVEEQDIDTLARELAAEG